MKPFEATGVDLDRLWQEGYECELLAERGWPALSPPMAEPDHRFLAS